MEGRCSDGAATAFTARPSRSGSWPLSPAGTRVSTSQRDERVKCMENSPGWRRMSRVAATRGGARDGASTRGDGSCTFLLRFAQELGKSRLIVNFRLVIWAECLNGILGTTRIKNDIQR